MEILQHRSLYTDAARQDLSTWLRKKESSFLRFARDTEGDLVALTQLDSNWTRGIALAAVALGKPQEWRLETLSFSRKDEWSEVGEDCTILSRAIDLILENSENKVVTDEDLTQFVARIFAPGWMLVVFEHPEGELSIIASSIPNDCRIENFDPGQLYCDMLEGGIEALQDPDGAITPDQ